jgi:hypothetical protein
MALGVAIGRQPDDHRLAIRARSAEDVDAALLERIKKEAGNEIDLQYTGPLEIHPAGDSVPRRRLALGGSTAHYRCSPGTIGFFARRLTDGRIGIVSNNHVLAAQDDGNEGDEVLHPAPADRGSSPNDVIAHLAGDYPRLLSQQPTVDCAFAPLVRGTSCDPLALSDTERLRSSIAVAEVQMEVEKIGRTSGRTRGRITAIDLDFFDVDYRCGRVSLFDQIEIEAVSEQPFCQGGDSGSLVFTRDHEPLGLLFLGTRAGGAFNCGRGYANPIANVMKALGIAFAA